MKGKLVCSIFSVLLIVTVENVHAQTPGQIPVFDQPGTGVAQSPGGDLYVIDNNRIRVLSGSGPTAPPVIASGGVVNAFSYTGGAIAPGELLSIFGSNLGTATPQMSAVENNHVPFVLGRTKVLFKSPALFGNQPGDITAVAPNQVNVFAPENLPPGTSVDIVVQVDGTPSAPVTVPVAVAAPSLISADGSGFGAGAILNQDGSHNSGSNPASPASVISLFGTGEGARSPQLLTGYLSISTPFSAPTQPVVVKIAGQSAEILYAGEAPFAPAGIFQINARVPVGVGPGDVPISVSVGSISSSKQITAAIR